jgi:nucleoredoxin
VSDAAAFPWLPPTLEEALGPSFLNEHNERVSLSSLTASGKYIALYFGAAWCGPCRAFSRRLRESYGAVLSEGGALEVIYVSSDQTGADAEAQRAAAPWLCVPYAERWRRDALCDLLGVQGLPALVLLDARLRVVNSDCRAAAERCAPFPWLPKLVWDADNRADWERSPADAPTLLVLAERAGASWDGVEAALTTLAREAADAPPTRPPGGTHAGRPPARPVFMLARERQGLGMAVRRLARLPDAGPRPQAVLLDMSANGTFYVMDATKELNAASLRAFMASYASGALSPQAGGPVQTITVAAALAHAPACGADGDEEINPWEAVVNCICCPITCPLICAFRCCLGCCMLTALGAAMGASGMAAGASLSHG